ncbi:MAG: hypothetical protein EXR48_04295 [Dehalococcoidia bacterium]|nr:hypothetical protein [Dehalococcoidia bacterium]
MVTNGLPEKRPYSESEMKLIQASPAAQHDLAMLQLADKAIPLGWKPKRPWLRPPLKWRHLRPAARFKRVWALVSALHRASF